jgi:lipoprotein-releasing system ATP-binding protein
MTPFVEARDLVRILPGDPPASLVADASLNVERGALTAIVGPSGCGKSSLVYLLGLLDRPTSGSLLVDGRDVSGLDGDARARLRLERMGFVFQFHFLLPEFTALENVMMPIRRLGRADRKTAETKARELLTGMGLGEKLAKTPDRLSGGERQRVAIARALANDPILILGDEPTGNLDSTNTAAVIEIFRSLAHRDGRAVVCVTHDESVAAAADIRISMLDGRVVNIAHTPKRA